MAAAVLFGLLRWSVTTVVNGQKIITGSFYYSLTAAGYSYYPQSTSSRNPAERSARITTAVNCCGVALVSRVFFKAEFSARALAASPARPPHQPAGGVSGSRPRCKQSFYKYYCSLFLLTVVNQSCYSRGRSRTARSLNTSVTLQALSEPQRSSQPDPPRPSLQPRSSSSTASTFASAPPGLLLPPSSPAGRQ